jgi:4-amino-4-deoxy-L-arabinose transferase-like glycosyltransferase
MNARQVWIAALLVALLLRLATLSEYPLHDTTEARYADIARLMVTSGDWITPQVEPRVPFWAKPPLSIWATATSFKIFGINEFAARLPSFLLTLSSLALIGFFARTYLASNAAVPAATILLSTALGFGAAGAVMTDATLMFSTTLTMISFWFATRESRSLWRYCFFLGLALGLLAKGPIALVLAGLPILVWSLWYQTLAWLWRAMPWLSGSALVLVIAAPWYIMAELRTPGFLEYFVVGEHWLRFVQSGWAGDLYGEAHSHPRGTIWPYGLLAALPWSLLALYAIGRAVKAGDALRTLPSLQAFLLLWALTPLVFFTFAGNILAAYVLPGLPAFALLMGNYLFKRQRQFAGLALLVPGVFVVAILTGAIERADYRSQRDLVNFQYGRSPASDLRYFPRLPHSASFYSAGRAQAVHTPAELTALVLSGIDAYVAMRKDRLGKLPYELRQCLQQDGEIHNYVIVRTQNGGCISCGDSNRVVSWSESRITI